jgi:hypothetical protein
MGVGDQRHTPAALPPRKTRYPMYRRLGGVQGRSGRVQKISSPQGFDPRTVQPVASRYTDWAIAALRRGGNKLKNSIQKIHLGEAATSWATQRITRYLWGRNVHHHAHNRPPLASNLSEIKSVHIFLLSIYLWRHDMLTFTSRSSK